MSSTEKTIIRKAIHKVEFSDNIKEEKEVKIHLIYKNGWLDRIIYDGAIKDVYDRDKKVLFDGIEYIDELDENILLEDM